MIMETCVCMNCPFICKNANVCKPRQLLNEMREYLPNVVDDISPTSEMTKPSISCTVYMNGREYYF